MLLTIDTDDIKKEIMNRTDDLLPQVVLPEESVKQFKTAVRTMLDESIESDPDMLVDELIRLYSEAVINQARVSSDFNLINLLGGINND
jgi:hypothetical protein